MAELIVNTGALLQNYRRYADAGQVIPILKGNGYGLGAQPLRDLLARQGVTLFACATPEEALALAQPETDLLLLCCVHELPLLRALLQRRVILSVESLAQAQAIDALHMDARVHLAVDSGFGRFGFLPETDHLLQRPAVLALELVEQVQTLFYRLKLSGVIIHLLQDRADLLGGVLQLIGQICQPLADSCNAGVKLRGIL